MDTADKKDLLAIKFFSAMAMLASFFSFVILILTQKVP